MPMIRSMAMAAIFWAITSPAPGGQSELALDQLTVPASRLGTDCRLPAKSTESREDGIGLRGGLWTGLPISSNPWRGNDELGIVAIRERLEPPSRLPDPPALSRPELARFRLQLARDIEEAYAAVYLTGRDFVIVYAVRFKELREIDRLRAVDRNLRAGVQIVGRTALRVTGPAGDCFALVADHLRELTKGPR